VRKMTHISEADLQRMAPHIRWEFEMFRLAAEKSGMLGAGASVAQSETTTVVLMSSGSFHVKQHKTVESLIFEALLIHFRILLQFFYASRQKGVIPRAVDGDVLARDYVGPLWHPTRPSWLPECWQRCNKLLAHLTIERPNYIENRTIAWQGFEGKVQHIEAGYAAFFRSLSPEKKPWFAQEELWG
jgi:hypothetical protein